MNDQTSPKSIGLWIGAALLITVIVIGAVKFADSGPHSSTGEVVKGLVPVSDADWIRQASSTASATLIEYSDFQCPACASYYPLVEKVVGEYGSSLQFVYRHFPLPQHKQAKSAAYAAEAAGKQGKFWEMYKLLFEGQHEWADKSDAAKTFESYALRLGLDLERFKKDVSSQEVTEKVETSYQGGVRATVNATPTFFLNGRKLQNPSSYEAFKELLDAAIATSS
jgi:protein-disulfide isomerase